MDNSQMSSEQESGATGTTVDSESEPLPPRRGLLLVAVALVVLTLDVIVKIIVVATLSGHEPVRVLGGLVYLQLIRNPGAAFSMATGMTWVLSVIAIAVVVAIVWILPRLRSIGWAVGLGLVLAGALGNLSDRIFRAPGPLRGHVIDFVSVFAPNAEKFPVFNVADSAITVGGVLIVLMALLGRDYDGRSTRKSSS
jgi:signal peptidase II